MIYAYILDRYRPKRSKPSTLRQRIITWPMNRKGFTLIELLVVVAVLALLASIVFSNLGGAREGARISNALSFQSQTHSLLGSDLVGWWNFNEGSGTTARDISGYDNHGTIVGATYVDGVPGTGGTALEFDGVGDYVETSHSVNYSEDFTVSAWLKRSVRDNWVRAVDLSGGDYPGLIGIHSNNAGFFGYRDSDNSPRATYYSIDNYVNVYEWFHVTIVKGDVGEDYPYRYAYVNGILSSSLKLTDINEDYEGNLTIGGSGNRAWPGFIDDVRIYSRALTTFEVSTLYAQTKNKYLANE